MDGYGSPNIPVVPRLFPSQNGGKKIPVIEEMYPYNDNRPLSSHINQPLSSHISQPLSPRTQFNNNDFNQQDNNNNHSFNQNYLDNSIKGRNNKNRLHVEALKDNSGDSFPTNSSYLNMNGYNNTNPNGFSYSNLNGNNNYPYNSDYKYFDNSKSNSNENDTNKSTKTLIIIFGIIIGLFSLTALAISVYLLIRMSTTTT